MTEVSVGFRFFCGDVDLAMKLTSVFGQLGAYFMLRPMLWLINKMLFNGRQVRHWRVKIHNKPIFTLAS